MSITIHGANGVAGTDGVAADPTNGLIDGTSGSAGTAGETVSSSQSDLNLTQFYAMTINAGHGGKGGWGGSGYHGGGTRGDGGNGADAAAGGNANAEILNATSTQTIVASARAGNGASAGNGGNAYDSTSQHDGPFYSEGGTGGNAGVAGAGGDASARIDGAHLTGSGYLRAAAVGGSGGSGGTGGNGGLGNPGGAAGVTTAGAAGGDAIAALTNNIFNVTGSTGALYVQALPSSGGTGGNYARSPLGWTTGQKGGDGGQGSAILTNNQVTGNDASQTITVSIQTGTSGQALGGFNPTGMRAAFGAPITNAVTMQGNSVDLGGGHDTLVLEFRIAQNATVTFGGNSFQGGAGNDTLSFGASTQFGPAGHGVAGVTFDMNIHSIGGFEQVLGTNQADRITGNNAGMIYNLGAGNDWVKGGGGADTFLDAEGVGHNDTYQGGGGNDTVSYQQVMNALNIDLNIVGAQDTGAGGVDTLSNIFNLIGGSGNDSLIGNLSSNRLTGYVGDDLLLGNGGDDLLYGGEGDDRLEGGIGIDMLDGGDGNDVLIGGDDRDLLVAGGGRNIADGGTGTGDDMLKLSGDRSDYRIFSVDGVNFLMGAADQHMALEVEQVIFADGEVSMADLTAGGASFDALLYLASHADLARDIGFNAEAGESHYVETGFKDGRATSGFDPLQYLAANADLARHFGYNLSAATKHYLQWGADEGRPTSGFDPLTYLASNADLSRHFGLNLPAATKHFVQWGADEGRPTSGFDPLMYLASNADLSRHFGLNLPAATKHFVQWGADEGRPTSGFDAMRYLASNGDLIAYYGPNTSAAIKHFVQWGADEGRPTTSFDPVRYLEANADLAAYYGNDLVAATEHYVRWGFKEGRPTGGTAGEASAVHATFDQDSEAAEIEATDFGNAALSRWFDLELTSDGAFAATPAAFDPRAVLGGTGELHYLMTAITEDLGAAYAPPIGG